MKRFLIVMTCLAATAAWAQEEPGALPEADVDIEPQDDVDVDVDVDTEPAPMPVEPMPSDGYAPAAVTATEPEPRGLERYGRFFGDEVGSVKAMVGGGDFLEDGAQNITGAGTTYEVRATLGTGSPIGVEGAYVGSTRGIADNNLEIPEDASLVSNGLEGALRLALPIEASELVDVRPFAFGGLGWQYMTLWGDGPVDGDGDEGDHIMTVPAGLGLEVGIGGLNLDTRLTYRYAVGSDIFDGVTPAIDDDDDLHSWNLSGGVGFEF